MGTNQTRGNHQRENGDTVIINIKLNIRGRATMSGRDNVDTDLINNYIKVII